MPDTSTPKEQLLELVHDLPDDASYAEAGKRFREMLRTHYIRAMVDSAEEDIEQGRTTPHEEFKKRRGFE